MLTLVLLVAALILLTLAGLSVSGGRLQLGWLGLALIALVMLLSRGLS